MCTWTRSSWRTNAVARPARYTALTKLGFPCYHMHECVLNNTNNNSFSRWREAIEAKYYRGKGKKFRSAEDFDELLWRYQVRERLPVHR